MTSDTYPLVQHFSPSQKSICQCLIHLIHFLLLSLFQLLLFPQLNLLHKLAAMPGHFIHLSGMDFGRSDAASKDALAQLAKPFRFELATSTFSCPPVPIFLSSTILGFPPASCSKPCGSCRRLSCRSCCSSSLSCTRTGEFN